MAHFAHYVRRDVVQANYGDPRDPWFAENQPDDQGFIAPAFHATRSHRGAAARVAAGDTIWLFAQLFSPWGKSPPALDARIEVACVRRRPGGNGFRYEAGPGSAWFPLSDGSACLSRLRTRAVDGATTCLLANSMQSVGQALQSMRELENVEEILRLSVKLSSEGVEFISYRLLDGTRGAFNKAMQIVQDGGAVFWDRWSLPRRLAERREFLKDRALDAYIAERIKAASVVWGIATPLYGADGSYSKKEMELASELNKLRTYAP